MCQPGDLVSEYYVGMDGRIVGVFSSCRHHQSGLRGIPPTIAQTESLANIWTAYSVPRPIS